ncbi:MAG TPA: uracil-DNA glycosylase [Actinomycetales bacterium]
MDPHPVTGELFGSPVPPGTGWPGDPATPRTPRATDAGRVREMAASSRSLPVLQARTSVCRACPRLVAWREQVATDGRRRSFADQPYWGRPSPGFGDERPGLLVVGLAPAANGANRTGRVFTGDRSGDWIWAALHRAGYASVPWSTSAADGQQLTGARIVPAVRCAPPANKPSPDERDTCAPWFDREVTLVEPHLRAVVVLGGFAFDVFLTAARRLGWTVPDGARPRFGHGVRVPMATSSGREVALIASYHVSQQNTFTGRLTEPMLDDVLSQARALTAGGPNARGSTHDH